jgi:hypothetical protein
MRHGVDGFSPSSWEPQEEGMMSTATNFPSVRNQGLIISRKKPNVRRCALRAATWNLHTTQPNNLLPTYDEVVNLTGLLETKGMSVSSEK